MIKNLSIKSFVYMFTFFCLVGCLSCYSQNPTEKVYIENEDFSIDDYAFHIHVGDNLWIETNSVHKDDKGFYTYESNIRYILDGKGIKLEREKKWKCPYCHSYWPIGISCQKASCPSKYK